MEHVDKVREVLRGLPDLDRARRVITRGEAVKMLKEELEDLRKRGYSMKEIAAVLTTNGIRIAKPTLTHYLRKPGGRTVDAPSAAKKVRRLKTKAADTSPVTANEGATSTQPTGTAGSTEFHPPDEAAEI
jgi:hypothetical protein